MATRFRPAGTHRVIKKLRGGGYAIYVYRRRGSGELLVRFFGETRAAALADERQRQTELIAALARGPARRVPEKAGETIRDLVVAYKAAADGYGSLAASTKRTWTTHLDRIASELGSMPVRALTAKGARAHLIDWRNKRASHPRAADLRMQVLKRVLSFALDRRLIDVDPSKGIKDLYRGGKRAGLIVTPEELDAVVSQSTPAAALAFRLMAETGLRRGDVVSLKWDDVFETHIVVATRKSGHRQQAFVTLTPWAKAVLSTLNEARQLAVQSGRIPSAHVLTTSLGRPWKPDSLTQAFDRARKQAGVSKRLHDLRGTAATRMRIAGWANAEIADAMGWEESQVSKILKHYVDSAQVAAGRLERLIASEAALKRTAREQKM